MQSDFTNKQSDKYEIDQALLAVSRLNWTAYSFLLCLDNNVLVMSPGTLDTITMVFWFFLKSFSWFWLIVKIDNRA